MATLFRRIIQKISNTASEKPTVPSTNNHSDGSWLSTDIYKGELFWNNKDGILYSRDDSDNIVGINGVTDRRISGVVTIEVDRTFEIGDENKLIQLDGSIDRVWTVPPNSSVAFDIGVQILLERIGTAELDIVAGSGVTINSVGGDLSLNEQYSMAVLIKKSTNTWQLSGDLKP